MTTKLRRARSVLATALVLVAGVILAMRTADAAARTTVVAYFDNSNGVFAGDDVLIRGVPVGKIVKIEPQPLRAKISFWFDRKYRVPADAAAAILSPQLVTGRAIQLTPPYAGGPTMADGTVIPQERTVVPVEWDDLRAQLQRLTALLQPTRPGGVSTLGALINTAADNLRGQGATIRDTIIKLSQAISALGDHSKDIFSTVTNLSTLVTALHDSADLLERLNHNLAAVTSLLADGPDKIGQAAEDLNAVVADVAASPPSTASDRHRIRQARVNHHRAGRQPRRHQADAAYQPDGVAELQQHLRTGQRRADRRAGGQQHGQPNRLPVRRDPGCLPAGRRASGQIVRAIPGADREEPPVQLPAAGGEPVRRGAGQA